MKNVLALYTFLILCLTNPLWSQRITPDHVEQSKRISRSNNHIEKTFKGTVVKMLFGTYSLGGAFDGIIFRKTDGSLMQLRTYSFFGANIGPHLKEGQKIEVTVTGDELLMETILYKDLYFKRLEVELKEPITGMAFIASVKTPKGVFSKGDRKWPFFNGPGEPVLNVKVKKRIRLKDKEGILYLENGDSLIFFRTGVLADVFELDEVSYLRPKKTGTGMYYKSLNVHRMSSGNPIYSASAESFNKMGITLGFGNSFLRSTDIYFQKTVSNNEGLINGLIARTENRLDTFNFAPKSAKAIMSVVNKASDQSSTVYYQELPYKNLVRAIDASGQTIIGETEEFITKQKEDYLEDKITYKGKVTEVQYFGRKDKNSFRSLILEDSVYIKISTAIALSIAEIIEPGKEISFNGWQRKEIPSEINQKGYTIMIPEKLTIDGITFTNNLGFSTSL